LETYLIHQATELAHEVLGISSPSTNVQQTLQIWGQFDAAKVLNLSFSNLGRSFQATSSGMRIGLPYLAMSLPKGIVDTAFCGPRF
jgi:hypothetical protein